MRRITLFFATLFVFISANGQIFSLPQKINADVINRLSNLYHTDRYKECIDSCEYYLGMYTYYISASNVKHPYRNWHKIRFLRDENNAEDIAAISLLACAATYKYSLTQFDVHSIHCGIEWAKICVDIYDDYLHERIPNDESTIETWSQYILYAECAIEASTIYGPHFLSIDPDDPEFRTQVKWFDKKSDRIFNVLYKNILGKDELFANYPLLQYKVLKVTSAQILRHKSFKVWQDELKKRMDAFVRMIQVCQQNNISNFVIPDELNLIVSILTTTVVDSKFCKKAGPDYERFCMENLIKLQDISYSLNGSIRYSQSPGYTLRDIQNSLEETDCAIIHFEAPVTYGSFYFKYDLGTRYRNYALIITKNKEIPSVWRRGYINDTIVNDLSKIREAYSEATRFYYVGTPRMSFIDVAGNDSSIVRLHSLSQLLQDRSRTSAGREITFIGDLNYTKVGDVSLTISERKGGNFGQLLGPAKELSYINTLYSNVLPICGDDATRNVVASEISKNNGIVHISTHGEFFSPSDDYTLEELILKKNVIENSCLILSGYNDNPQSSLCYMSASDVLKIKHINSEVVFLDACMLGKGAVSVSGSVGMAEAFHLIGAKNVICYLEPVDDELATKFSNSFYLELYRGASCHDAFFNAKKSINQNIKVVLWE